MQCVGKKIGAQIIIRYQVCLNRGEWKSLFGMVERKEILRFFIGLFQAVNRGICHPIKIISANDAASATLTVGHLRHFY